MMAAMVRLSSSSLLLTPLIVLLSSAPVAPAQSADSSMVASCARGEYQRCVHMADPLLKDPRYIFPDNMADIDFVCRTWSQFVACVKRYIDRCFTESRRQEFNKAVESPVDSVHQMCTVPQYQNEYLLHAGCIKNTLTEDSHCGRHYRHLVEQVSGEVERVSLCCSHYRFRECVLDQTARQCDNPRPGISTSGSASRFARQILDKALSFLRDQCTNFIPNSGDCPGLGIGGSDNFLPARDVISPDSNSLNNRPGPAPAPISPWGPRPKQPGPGGPGSVNSRREKAPSQRPADSSAAAASGAGGSVASSNSGGGGGGTAGRSTDSGMATGNAADKIQKQDWAIAHKQSNTQQQPGGGVGSPWLPGRVEAVRPTPPTDNPGPGSMPGVDGGAGTSTLSAGSQLGQGHSRPASYGRGMSWPTSTPMTPTTRSPAPGPGDWMPNSYHVTNNGISRVSTPGPGPDPWFPSTLSGSDAAVNSNAVDEPNQQGLAKRGAGAPTAPSAALSVLATCATLVMARLVAAAA